MLNIYDEYLKETVQISKDKRVSKERLIAFAKSKIGNNIARARGPIKEKLSVASIFNENIDKLLQETFKVGENNIIESLKDNQYAEVASDETALVIEQNEKGIQIIKRIAKEQGKELEEISLIDLPIAEALSAIKTRRRVCGIDLGLLSFVLARETILYGEDPTREDFETALDKYIFEVRLFRRIASEIDEESMRIFEEGLEHVVFSPYITVKKFHLEEIKEMSNTELIYCFGEKLSLLINALNLAKGQQLGYTAGVETMLSTLPDQVKEVLERREKETLETIGKSKGITRERIRQIEKKALLQFQELYQKNFVTENNDLNFIYPHRTKAIPIDKILSELTAHFGAAKTLLRGINYLPPTKYIKEIDCIVSSEIEYEIFEDAVYEILGDYFRVVDLYNLVKRCHEKLAGRGYTKQSILNYIEAKYKRRRASYFINGIQATIENKVNKIMEKYFDEGMHHSDLGDIIKFNQYAEKEFGEKIFAEDDTESNKRKVQSIIERIDSQQIFRGTYVHRSKAPQLTQSILDKISSYINRNDAGTPYSDIFETFKEELLSLGITNKYMIQGAMQKYKNILFQSKRDYVLPLGVNTSLRQTMKKWVDSQEGIFTYEDFEKEFKGVAESVFVSVRNENNKLIYLWKRGYINYFNLKIPQEDVEMLVKTVEEKIESSEEKYISAYAMFNMFKKEAPQKLQEWNIEMPYDLFSILEFVIRDKYKCSRPMISKFGVEIKTWEEAFYEYVEGKNIVDISKAREYIASKTKRHVYVALSVLEFVRGVRDEFIVVEKNKLARKELLNVTQSELSYLKKVIEEGLSEQRFLPLYMVEQKVKKIAGIEANIYYLYGLINEYLSNRYVAVSFNPAFKMGELVVARIGGIEK